MKKFRIMAVALMMTGGLMSMAFGAASIETNTIIIQKDITYDQDLKFEASPDKTVTPAKVMRWMMGLRGQTLPPPSPTEFQPIVNAHDGHFRIIAALAYKF